MGEPFSLSDALGLAFLTPAEDWPKQDAVIAAYREAIERETRAVVLAEVEAELRKIHDMLMPVEAQMFARLRGTP